MATIDLSTVNSVILLASSNDRNGNPRRAYVAFSGGHLRGFWDQGYDGVYAVPAELRELAMHAPSIMVGASELKRYRKWAAQLSPELCGAA